MAEVGTVQNLSGQVVAKNIYGQIRELRIGDLVNQNDIIEVASGSSVIIALDNGDLLSLREFETVFLDESVVGVVESRDAVVEDVAAMQETVTQALENDQEIDGVLEAPAAGEGSVDDFYDYNPGYHAGDASRGDVGTYLLNTQYGRENNSYEQFVADADNKTAPENEEVVSVVRKASINPPLNPNDGNSSDDDDTGGKDGVDPVNGVINIVEDLSNTDGSYQVTSGDFGQPFENPMTAVRIQSLPGNGTLSLDGVPVVPGQEIDVSDIDAGKLQFDPVDHTDADSVFTYEVQDGTTWGPTSETSINIEALADKPIISIEGTSVFSQTIDVDNINAPDLGFTVKAFDSSDTGGTYCPETGETYGNPSTVMLNNFPGGPEGFGVAGDVGGVVGEAETGYNESTGRSEHLVFTFDEDVDSVDVAFAWKYGTANDPKSETAKIEFYRDGVLVGDVHHYGGSDLVDPAITLQPGNGQPFDTIVFSAPAREQGSRTNDYLINSLTFQKSETSTEEIRSDVGEAIKLDVSQALVDTDGSEYLSLLNLTGMPVGTILSDGEHSVVVSESNQSVILDDWNFSDLTMIVDPDQVGDEGLDFTLTATTTTTEISNNSSASNSATLEVHVDRTVSTDTSSDNALIFGTDENDYLLGEVEDDYIEGRAGNDILLGRAGDDYIDGGEGADLIKGGTGDDRIVFDSNDTFIDGGEGFDTLIVNDSGDLDFSNVTNIEKIELADSSGQTVELSVDDVLAMTDSNNTLEFDGENDDQVVLNDDGYTPSVPATQATPGNTPETFTNNNDPTQVAEIINADPDPAGEFKIITDDGTEVG